MDTTKKNAGKKNSEIKSKPIEQRNMTTSRYIDDSEGITVTKRPKKTK